MGKVVQIATCCDHTGKVHLFCIDSTGKVYEFDSYGSREWVLLE